MRRTLYQIKAVLEGALPSGEMASLISRRARLNTEKHVHVRTRLNAAFTGVIAMCFGLA